jgi:hypothetical protein
MQIKGLLCALFTTALVLLLWGRVEVGEKADESKTLFQHEKIRPFKKYFSFSIAFKS